MNHYLSPRLKQISPPNESYTYFDWYMLKPGLAQKYLNDNVLIDEENLTAKLLNESWRFNYRKYLKDCGYKITREFGFDQGVIYKIKKV